MVNRDAVVLDAYESELPRVAGVIAVVWQSALLLGVLADLRAYRTPAAPIAVWLGLVAAAAWLVPRARAGGLTRGEAAGAIAIALGVVTVLGWYRSRTGVAMTVDWSVFGTGWLLVMVALSRPPKEWVSGALLIFGTNAVFLLRIMGPTQLGLARLAATGYLLIVIPIVFGALRPALRVQARLAARRAALASRAAAERAVLGAVREDRQARLEVLERGALPLLRGIADGSLDPAHSEVMRRCGEHAAALRRALADRARHGGWLLAELAPTLDGARARGVQAEVQVVGDPGPPCQAAAGAARAALGMVLAALPPQPVTLTILAPGDDVELFATFGALPVTGSLPGLAEGDLNGSNLSQDELAQIARTVPTAAHWRAAFETCDAGSGCLEIRWRKAGKL